MREDLPQWLNVMITFKNHRFIKIKCSIISFALKITGCTYKTIGWDTQTGAKLS